MTLRRNYCFIIGAGGSAEINFPVGNRLVSDIAAALNISTDDFGNIKGGNRGIVSAFEALLRETPPPDGQRWNAGFLGQICKRFARNMPLAPSIDNYIEAVKNERFFPEVGKMAISDVLLGYERNSPLFFTDASQRSYPEFAQLPPFWLTNLFQLLVTSSGYDEFLDRLSKVAFITFNYDRCIEQFFRFAVSSYFDLPLDKTDEILADHLRIFHVYGSLGELKDRSSVSFGAKGGHEIWKSHQRIFTFTEGVEEDRVLPAIQWLEDADILTFVGFSFLPLNLRALRPRGQKYKCQVFGTSLGVSQDNLAIYTRWIQQNWLSNINNKVDLRPVKGEGLISDLSGLFLEDDL